MNTKNLKPFDLQAALNGKPVMLRDGEKAYVRHHETDLYTRPSFRLLGYAEDGAQLAWCENGSLIHLAATHASDIIGMYPETRIINGFVVPAPETKEPELGCAYFAPHMQADGCFDWFRWDGDDCDMRSLKRGVVFLNKEDAAANAKAMLGINPCEESEK